MKMNGALNGVAKLARDVAGAELSDAELAKVKTAAQQAAKLSADKWDAVTGPEILAQNASPKLYARFLIELASLQHPEIAERLKGSEKNIGKALQGLIDAEVKREKVAEGAGEKEALKIRMGQLGDKLTALAMGDSWMPWERAGIDESRATRLKQLGEEASTFGIQDPAVKALVEFYQFFADNKEAADTVARRGFDLYHNDKDKTFGSSQGAFYLSSRSSSGGPTTWFRANPDGRFMAKTDPVLLNGQAHEAPARPLDELSARALAQLLEDAKGLPSSTPGLKELRAQLTTALEAKSGPNPVAVQLAAQLGAEGNVGRANKTTVLQLAHQLQHLFGGGS